MSIDVDGLKARTDIVSVVGAYVALKKRGAEFVGLCPFHADKNPSLWVSPVKQFCHCFSCGANKDVIEFIQDIEGLDFKGACERLGAKADWTPKAPIKLERSEPLPERITAKPPADTPAPNMAIRALGEPSRIWPYRDTDGGIYGYVARYDTPEGKQVRCWSFGRRGERPASWGCGHWNKPRPLYGLDRLAARAEAPVLIVEGEKAADAAQALLPSYVVIAWPGGSQSWHKAGWEPLRGRKVLLWPDNDAAGIECMDKLAALLADPQGLACAVRLIDPNRMPDGFDAADWTGSRDELIAWAKPRARDYSPPTGSPDEPPPLNVAELPPAQEDASSDAQPSRRRRPALSVVGNNALAPQEDAEALPAAMSEDMLADHFATTHAERWRYVKPWGSWLEWRGDGWYRDDTAKVDRLAVEVTRQAIYWPEAAKLSDDGKRKVNSRRTAGSVRDLAMSDRRIAAVVDQWDTDPWLLGVPSGVVNLRTGKLFEARPDDYMTKRCTVAPEPGVPELWLAFLRRITEEDESLVAYLQRFAGYALTGVTSEHALAFLYGTGANGKTTFLQTLMGVFGDYAVSAGFEVFAESKNDRHPTEIARLRGARLVVTEETDAGGRWNEGRVKRLTGGGKISAHFMRQDDFEFEPQFKLLIAGNHKPLIRAVDEAIKRRIHLVPFTVTIPPEERDKELLTKLEPEWPRILQWCIDGCMAWQRQSLSPGDRIISATEQYVESEDVLGAWLDECCDREGTGDGRALFENYRKWCDAQGEHAWSRRSWSNAMLDRGFQPTRNRTSRGFQGVSLKIGQGQGSGRYPDD